MATNQEILGWLSANPGATDQQIAQAMQQYGVDPRQLADATGVDYGQVLNRYNAATGTTAPIANADIADWYSRNQGLSDPEIAQYMNNYGVSSAQLADSLGSDYGTVQSRFNAATGNTGVSNADINYYLQSNPGATDTQIRGAMDQFGVTPDQMATATGLPTTQVQQRYDAAAPSIPSAPVDPSIPAPGVSPAFATFNSGPAPDFAAGGYGAYSPSPYLGGMADDIGRRTSQQLGETFNQIRGNAVGVGGLGGSRQGVAEGVATGRAMDSMQGQLSNLYNTDYQNAQARGLQRYGTDVQSYLGSRGQDVSKYSNDLQFGLGVGNLGLGYHQAANQFDLGVGGLQNQRLGLNQNYALGQGNQALAGQGQMLDFWSRERGLDQSGAALGANLLNSGTMGQWGPLNQANNVYGNYTGFGNSTTSGQQGGGWQGLLGGALSGAATGRQMGWW